MASAWLLPTVFRAFRAERWHSLWDFMMISSIPCLSNSFATSETVTSVSIPAAFSSVGSYAFCGYAKLTEVTLPSTLTEIGQGAFMGCTGLTSMSLPSGMKKINPSTFSGCSSLAQITVPNSVKEFGSYAFTTVPLWIISTSPKAPPSLIATLSQIPVWRK